MGIHAIYDVQLSHWHASLDEQSYGYGVPKRANFKLQATHGQSTRTQWIQLQILQVRATRDAKLPADCRPCLQASERLTYHWQRMIGRSGYFDT